MLVDKNGMSFSWPPFDMVFFNLHEQYKTTCGFEKIIQGDYFGISCAASAKVMLSDSSQLQRRGIVSKHGVRNKGKSWLTKM